MDSDNQTVYWGLVIVAAGAGIRMGHPDKVLLPLAGQTPIERCMVTFSGIAQIGELVVVGGEHTLVALRQIVGNRGVVVQGGATRAESVQAGVAGLSSRITHVLVHDAARPLLRTQTALDIMLATESTGAAIPAIGVSDTVHQIDQSGRIIHTPDRNGLVGAQTPQGSRVDWLREAFAHQPGTSDEGGLLAAAGYPVAVVAGDPDNIKLTWPSDVDRALRILDARGEGAVCESE